MRWLGFGIVAVIGLVAQTTLGWRFQLGGMRPDWILVLVVFFALHARAEEGIIAGCVLGVLADLMSIERFGLMTLLYGLTSLVMFLCRDYFFIDHPLTHFFLTWIPAVGVSFASSLYCAWFVGGASSGWVSSLSLIFGAAYTAVWAVPIHAVLSRFPHFLGVRSGFGRGGRSRALRPKHV